MLRRGIYQRLYADEQTFAFARKLEDRSFVVVINAGEERKITAMPFEMFHSGNPATIFGPDTHPYIENGTLHIEVPHRTGIVVRV